ncbi:hypothetical protein Scep_022348 [Stephania cephalantha]|uniref:Phospholipid-transporting ATPase n=1 Tax=Stephania cephalantha TaxID=152367 RepID=A0AAP0FH74_9MAGN
MVGGDIRKKLHLSKILSFSCRRPVVKEDVSQIGGPGFSRVVFCNYSESDEGGSRDYCDNYVRTTKYTLANFLPKSFFEQFRRVANLYFLVAGCLAFTPLAPYTAVSAILPLVVVIGATMLKEGVEDWRRRKQDIKVNGQKVKVHHGNGNFEHTEWKNLRVGDIVKVEKDEFFPADLLLLSSSYEDAICYVETMNLDGETNLKLKQAMDVTLDIMEDSHFRDFRCLVKCEDPNASLYTFVGSMEFKEQHYSLSPQQLLLRDSKLRNTDYIYGAVIFTGHDTKVVQNAMNPPSKRSKIERKMDKIVYLLFSMLLLLAVTGSVAFGIWTKEDLENGRSKRWYLRPDNSKIFYDPKRAPIAAIMHLLTALILYNYLIPISLYVSIEIVKVLQSIFINQDLHMYHEKTNKPARARTSNLNEELGQVDTILSDKTGTLTCNSMEFVRCSIAGTAYGLCVTDVQRARSKKNGSPLIHDVVDGDNNSKASVKGFNFRDKRIENGNWVNEPHPDAIQKFLRLLAICHTALPEVDTETGNIFYEAESPDEAAFVIAAKELGFEFYNRTQTSISLHELDPISGTKVNRSYKLLNVLEFNSTRKRMSVIVKDEEGRLLLFCKGADSVMLERLSPNASAFEEQTKEHMDEYADEGLRTLVAAYRELDEEEYNEFNEEFNEAKNSVSADRDVIIDEVANKIERDLILLGATAVEDKLQDGIIISLDTPHIKTLEKEGDKSVITKASKGSIIHQLNEGKARLSASNGSSDIFALIIDGKSLAYALDDNVKDMFLELAVGCASVICCRSSPKQKALVTRLVKSGTGKTTLAIGDGANDVGMLQEADIGVGISGVEGMQAVMSSDIAIAQFRFLERLLLVHGHWCYRRISTMFPQLYQEGVQNVLFSWKRILSWMFNGVCNAIVIFFFCTSVLETQAFRKGGQIVELQVLGTTMYSCVVWVVNCQMALSVSYFTLIQHIIVWGSILLWYIFLFAYGSMPPRISTTAYKVFLEACMLAPSYWLVILLVVFSALLPFFLYSAISMQFFPMYHQMIQWKRLKSNSDDPENRPIEPTTAESTTASEIRR